jgi:hypothetical protein
MKLKAPSLTILSLCLLAASVILNEVAAEFQKATSCPTVHLEFRPIDVGLAGVKNHFNRFVLDIDEKQPGASKGTQDLATLFCVWTEQINAGRARRGMIRAMNQILNGAEQEAN